MKKLKDKFYSLSYSTQELIKDYALIFATILLGFLFIVIVKYCGV